MVRCPACNSVFADGEAPWQKKVEYCSIHDRTYLSGTDCEFCTPQQTLDRQRAAEKQRTDALGEDYNAANKPVEVASGGRTLEEAMRRARESA